jgi:hypothetical protein
LPLGPVLKIAEHPGCRALAFANASTLVERL